MITIDFKQIQGLAISPTTCVEWVKEAFSTKAQNLLPPKISMHLEGSIFFNTMPCYLRTENRIGVKTVSRFPNEKPALKSELLLWNAKDGHALAMMDATWITTMRTGAVAALAAQTFICAEKWTEGINVCLVGLGNTARATLLCLRAICPAPLKVFLMKYKDQAEQFVERFSDMENVSFETLSDKQAMLLQADVVFSCVTAMDELFATDAEYPKGITVIPVHTRGFQNCDLFFDKVYGDDTGHVCNFKHFKQFKKFAELSDVLTGRVLGRESEEERILSYNIGISLHDVLFASRIYDRIEKGQIKEFDLNIPTKKFWV